MAGTVEKKLAELGISLPQPKAPVANYVPYGDFEAPLKPTDILFGGTHAWSSRITSSSFRSDERYTNWCRHSDWR